MIRQDYNSMAEAYGRNRKLHPDVLSTLIERGRLEERSKVLEVGCGTGNYITAIAAATGARCTGIDPSREMLRIARGQESTSPEEKGQHPEVAFQEASAEALPFPDGTFDLVYSVDVIHHIEDRDAAAGETARVLKSGGIAMVVTESEDDLRHRTPHVTYFPETVDVELVRYPTIAQVESELAAAGLDVDPAVAVSRPVQIEDIQPFEDKAYSSLHLISEEAFAAGIARMRVDIEKGPIDGVRRYTIVIARKPER